MLKISALKVFGQVNSTLNKRTFRECIDAIVKSFPEEDVFESLIHFLNTSVEVRLDTVYTCYVSLVFVLDQTGWFRWGVFNGFFIVLSRKLFLVVFRNDSSLSDFAVLVFLS